MTVNVTGQRTLSRSLYSYHSGTCQTRPVWLITYSKTVHPRTTERDVNKPRIDRWVQVWPITYQDGTSVNYSTNPEYAPANQVPCRRVQRCSHNATSTYLLTYLLTFNAEISGSLFTPSLLSPPRVTNSDVCQLLPMNDPWITWNGFRLMTSIRVWKMDLCYTLITVDDILLNLTRHAKTGNSLGFYTLWTTWYWPTTV